MIVMIVMMMATNIDDGDDDGDANAENSVRLQQMALKLVKVAVKQGGKNNSGKNNSGKNNSGKNMMNLSSQSAAFLVKIAIFIRI